VVPQQSENKTLTIFGNLNEATQVAPQSSKLFVGYARGTAASLREKDLVEPDGIEPTTSSMPLKRSPN
jgi:hypothetical protein